MNVPAYPSAPIFILSCNRSGSSLLRYIVDTHPDIASPAELNLGDVCEKNYYLVAQTLGEALYMVEPDKEELVLAEVRRLVLSVMDRYVDAKGKKMWCEKSPHNLQHLHLIKAIFPGARFICLHRHAMDVVHSCLESSRLSLMPEQLNYVCRNSGSILGAMVQNWIEKTQRLLEFEAKNPTQCFRITYESYVLHPYRTLKPMFEFLGVDWDAKLLDSVFAVQHDLGPEDPKVAYSNSIRKDLIGKGAHIDSHHIPTPLLEKMNTLLTELGYTLVDDNWGVTSYDYLFANLDQSVEKIETASQADTAELLRQCFLPRIHELNQELKDRRVVYKIIVTGAHGGTWTIDLANPDCPLEQGHKDADCTFTFSAEDVIGIFNGTLNPVERWMQGKLHVAGDRTLAEVFCWFLAGRLKWRKPSASSSWWL
ncbi:MAG: hypothetical protein F6K30_17675 [Cyanothece sp. SIO2G6]|nr:hypothetical protein [Cyanothece sp. SIO2G6]